MKAPSVAPATAIQVFADTAAAMGFAMVGRSGDERASMVGCGAVMGISSSCRGRMSWDLVSIIQEQDLMVRLRA
jgi:hypothetical protein